MAAYVYALNTNIRTIGGQTVGVVDYRYKEHTTAFGSDELNQKLYNKLCARRVKHFEKNTLPTLMTFSSLNKADTMVEGSPVYICAGSCFDDYKVKTQVGTLRKDGNRWTIEYLPNADKLIAIHNEAEAFRAKQAAEADF